LTCTAEALDGVIAMLANGTGPVALDAERASGFRYGQRAQLVQLFRRQAGIALIDPTVLPDLSGLSQALEGAEWVLHAASQDLACLAELGLVPKQLFDTELASRLLGDALVGLATVVGRTLGISLAKEHSAQDWSQRPLPDGWLNYAALDVALLIDVRDHLEVELRAAGKLELAREEFKAVLLAPPPAPRPDPWRRTKGSHQIRDRRGFAIVRELWQAREDLARQLDLAPGRVLPDAAIVAVALAKPESQSQLDRIAPFNGRNLRRRQRYWWRAVDRALQIPVGSLPPMQGPRQPGPPNPRAWPRHHPQASQRLEMVKAELARLSQDKSIPVEHLAPPDLLRQVVFAAPSDPAAALRAGRARDWQVKLVAPIVAKAMTTYPEASASGQ